jgi:hypothetical protein
MELKEQFEREGIRTQVIQHVDPNSPDAVFIGSLVGAEEARLVLSSVPYEIEYIFRLDYPKTSGGDPSGLLIGIGYMSTHNQENPNEILRPIKISETQLNSLIESGISNTEFQYRLRQITSF